MHGNNQVYITMADTGDAGEILAIQKMAYRSEAEIHDDFSVQPLHQTLEETKREFQDQLFLRPE